MEMDYMKKKGFVDQYVGHIKLNYVPKSKGELEKIIKGVKWI